MALQFEGQLIEARTVARVEGITGCQKIVVGRGARGRENQLQRDQSDAKKNDGEMPGDMLRDSTHTCYIIGCGAILRKP